MPFEDLPYDQFISKWSIGSSLMRGIAGCLCGSIGLIFILVAVNVSVQYVAFVTYLSFFTLVLFLCL